MMRSAELGNVSRETQDRLNIYVDLVVKWTPRINLVSKSTLPQIWDRHIKDSLQVARLGMMEEAAHWVDLGSGGGFPGLVAAIMARDVDPDICFTLVESDQRKCAFLRTVSRECDLNAVVLADRIEKIPSLQADILSARALASLPDLLQFCERHLKPNGMALFPKGITWKKEVSEAQERWAFDYDMSHSSTEKGAVVLKIKGVSRV